MWRQEVLPELRSQIKGKQIQEELLFVLCAGENDVDMGISLDSTIRAMEDMLASIVEDSGLPVKHVLILGPKFEPWQQDDPASKKKYSKLSRSMDRACQRRSSHGSHHPISFLDSLTLFCGDSASKPGAALMGKAQADPTYFASDQLHLSPEGYEIWKDEIEKLWATALSESD